MDEPGALPPPTCADCKAFFGEGKDMNGDVSGLCRRRPELGEVPAGMPCCGVFLVREERIGKVAAAEARGRRGGAVPGGVRGASPARRRATLEVPVEGDTSGEITMDRDGLKQVLRELLEEETMYGYPEMAGRWDDGTLVITPGDPQNQPKEVPLAGFFHKIVMIRDRLRVLEAKINGHEKLSDGDKVELQAYISKCYGTLTTFNVLFRNREDQFNSKGE